MQKNQKAFVAENVKGLLTANKRKAIEIILKDFEKQWGGICSKTTFI